MDCEYLLVYKFDRNEKTVPFHALTPQEAVEQGRKIVRQKQKELVEEFPFSPPFVRAVLYRGFQEFSGAEFVTIVKPPVHADSTTR